VASPLIHVHIEGIPTAWLLPPVVLQVAAEKGRVVACALDTKGPEIRTAMLKDGKDIMLQEGERGLHLHPTAMD
jgi:hypothetical protein